MYSFAAITGEGLTVAVCPDRLAIRRHLEYFHQAGFQFPDIAVLDGSQMPHEARAVAEAINHHKVRLVYTTPHAFATLNFLNLLVHHPVNFIMIEQAHLLLPDFTGSHQYTRLLEGWYQLQQHPQVVLFTQPLPLHRLSELTQRLQLAETTPFLQHPSFENTRLRVKMVITQHQKFQFLSHLLSGMPKKGALGRIFNPGSVIIQTCRKQRSKWLAKALGNYGFETVIHYEPNMSPEERRTIEEVFHARQDVIVVTSGYESRYLRPPAGESLKVIFWDAPASVEESFGLLFQVPDATDPLISGWFLHSREDFFQQLNRLRSWEGEADGIKHQRVLALKKFRHWVLSKSCRHQSLVSFYQGQPQSDLPPCGVCDRCHPDSKQAWYKRWLEPWLY